MSRHLAWFFSVVVMLAVSAPLQALNYEVGGCKTGSGYVNFTTISAAVAGVPAGSKILVCPGAYPEQVTITQPLTLQGIASNNSNRAVIAINPIGGLATNVTSIIGQGLYAQVLVQNVNPPGPVNITGITVDGGGGNVGCSTSVGLVGIFYAAGKTRQAPPKSSESRTAVFAILTIGESRPSAIKTRRRLPPPSMGILLIPPVPLLQSTPQGWSAQSQTMSLRARAWGSAAWRLPVP